MKSVINTTIRFAFAIAIAMLMSVNAHAVIKSYFVSGPVKLVNAPQVYQTAQIKINLNPSQTNWIAWSRIDHLASYSGKNTIDGASAKPNFGIDDYFTLTITNPKGISRSFTLDNNDKWGNSSGQQAVIFGDKSVAPDVMRFNLEGKATTFNEAGIANSFLNNNIAGLYTLTFNFKNMWNEVAGHQSVYLLVDTCIPEPATLALAALGLAGVTMIRRRRAQRAAAV